MRDPHCVLELSPENINDYLPTFGYPGFSLDVVADEKLVKSGYDGHHVCFSDTHSFQALARLLNGPITSLEDLQAAETALQSLVFFDQVVLLNPAFIVFEGGKGQITRSSSPTPEPLGGDLTAGIVSDELLICEHVNVAAGAVVDSSLGDRSCLLGKEPKLDHHSYLSETPVVSAALSTMPNNFRLPAFFSDPNYQQYFDDRGFTGKLYSTVGASVAERQGCVPGARVEVRLPLLTWCLLSRATTRPEMFTEIRNLREEFSFARAELAELDYRMASAERQREKEDLAMHYNDAFEQVVAAARQSNFSYVRHIIYDVIDFATGSLPSKALKIINPKWRPENPDTMVQRSIAARSFKEILDLKTTEAALKGKLYPSEVSTLEAEARALT